MLKDALATLVFAQAVLLSDGYFQLRDIHSLELEQLNLGILKTEEAKIEKAVSLFQNVGPVPRSRGNKRARPEEETHEGQELVLKPRDWRRTLRYFEILNQMPIELQMVLCNYTFGVPKDLILSHHSELALRRTLM